MVPNQAPKHGLPVQDPLSPRVYRPYSQTVPPDGFGLNAIQARRIAERTSAVKAARAAHPGLKGVAYISPLRLRQGAFWHWDVIFSTGGADYVEVELDPYRGEILQITKQPDIGWQLLLGAPGVLGGKLNAPYIWLPLCLLFILPFLDPKRPFRLLHFDLLVLLGFGVSHYYFNHANISASTPLAYPVLAYLLVRALMIGFRPRKRPGPLIPVVPLHWLAAGIVFLAGFRLGLNLFDSNVIDVGYAGVLGANRVAHGLSLYGWNLDWHPNTYGPVTYLAYVPFEWIWPNNGAWNDLPAAHAASLTFDALTMLGMYMLGTRLREGQPGRALGIVLAYAWAAFPYTTYVLESNSNDALTAMFVVWALVFMRSPIVRGAMVALGGAAKFAPFALAPLLGSGRGERRGQQWFLFLVGFTTVVALVILPFTDDVGLRKFYEATAGYQADRPSPFSIWGLYDGLQPLRRVVEVATVVLAVVLAAFPRRRTELQVTALAAAVLIAVEASTSHWFYLYIVWFTPPLLAALFGEYGSSSWRIPVALPDASASTRTAFSHGSSSDGSNRAGTWVRNLPRACSRRTPMTPPRAPVIPTSVT